jgi:G10 protein
MASFMRRLKGRAPPEGWELLESTIEDFEAQMRDAVAEDHDGKRKNETTWRVHRIHFEKNRFIFDLMYKQKALSKELVRVPFAAPRVSPRLRALGAPKRTLCVSVVARRSRTACLHSICSPCRTTASLTRRCASLFCLRPCLCCVVVRLPGA